jgi:hypothetical protein
MHPSHPYQPRYDDVGCGLDRCEGSKPGALRFEVREMSARYAPSDNGAGRKIRTPRFSSCKSKTITNDRGPYRIFSLRYAVANAGRGGELLLTAL